MSENNGEGIYVSRLEIVCAVAVERAQSQRSRTSNRPPSPIDPLVQVAPIEHTHAPAPIRRSYLHGDRYAIFPRASPHPFSGQARRMQPKGSQADLLAR